MFILLTLTHILRTNSFIRTYCNFHSFLFRSCWTNCVSIFFFPVMGIQISIMSVKSQFLFYAKKFSLFCLFSIFSAEMQDSESIVKKKPPYQAASAKIIFNQFMWTTPRSMPAIHHSDNSDQICHLFHNHPFLCSMFFFSFSVFSHSLIEWMKTLFEPGDLFLDC